MIHQIQNNHTRSPHLLFVLAQVGIDVDVLELALQDAMLALDGAHATPVNLCKTKTL